MPENGVERWTTCKSAFSQIERMSNLSGDGTPRVGFNHDYSCNNPNVTIEYPESVDKYFDPDGNVILEALELHPYGWTAEEKVQEALTYSCADCPFFESRKS